MARTTLNSTLVPGPYAALGQLVTWTDADTVNLNRVRLTGRQIVLARNTHATDAATVTVTSRALNGRTGNITAQSIAAGAMRVYQRFPLAGWQQTDGFLYVQGSAADIEFAVLQLPE